MHGSDILHSRYEIQCVVKHKHSVNDNERTNEPTNYHNKKPSWFMEFLLPFSFIAKFSNSNTHTHKVLVLQFSNLNEKSR